jgi:hypothetical protein
MEILQLTDFLDAQWFMNVAEAKKHALLVVPLGIWRHPISTSSLVLIAQLISNLEATDVLHP